MFRHSARMKRALRPTSRRIGTLVSIGNSGGVNSRRNASAALSSLGRPSMISNSVAINAAGQSWDEGSHRIAARSQAALFSSASPKLDVPVSNLTFDKKSSFAPLEQSNLEKIVLEDVDGDDENDENDEAAASDDLEKRDNDEDAEDYDVHEDEDEDLDVTEMFSKRHVPTAVIPLPERLKVDVRHVLDGSTSGTIHLDPTVFGIQHIRVDLIKQNVDYIRSKMRGKRKAKTKTIGEVSGSGRKVRQQKGTGKARAGHSRPAHWRGGAKAHGPKNTKDYGNVKINKKTKALAICSALSQKLKEGNLIVVDHMKLSTHKTKEWATMLSDYFGIAAKESSALIIDHYTADDEEAESGADASYLGVPVNLWVASGNLHMVKVGGTGKLNVYDILKKDKLIISLAALEQIESRWKH